MKRALAWTLAVVAALGVVSAVLLLDVKREFETALDNLQQEQRTLATAVAADFEARLHRWEETE
ncbi:MAG TPA: hypothetical protein VFX59_07220, partial [Polyangiales bacterium]|nr:hypothetical protein [Polyangiales bacterium]